MNIERWQNQPKPTHLNETQIHPIINWVKWVLTQLNPINTDAYWVLIWYPIMIQLSFLQITQL